MDFLDTFDLPSAFFAVSWRDVWKNREKGDRMVLNCKYSMISVALIMLHEEILFIYIKTGISAHWICVQVSWMCVYVCLYTHRCKHTHTQNIVVANWMKTHLEKKSSFKRHTCCCIQKKASEGISERDFFHIMEAEYHWEQIPIRKGF